MRVGIYTFRITEQPTGLARYAISLTRAMRRVDPDIEIILLTPYRTNPNPWYDEFPVHFLGGPGDTNPWRSMAGTPAALRRSARVHRLDVIHAPANVAPFVGVGNRVARVATVHDLAPLTLGREHRRVSRIGYATAIPTLRWTADAVLTVSKQVADDLVRITRLRREKIYVTPNGVELPSPLEMTQWQAQGVPELGLEASARYFLYVGDIRPRKNLKRILQAFGSVHVTHSDIKLVVAGQLMHRAGLLDDHAAELGSSLIRPGYVDDDVLHRLYAGALAVVMPSLAEGFGMPALEAMAHGTPAIVSNIPVLSWLTGDAGIQVDPRSTGRIRDAMLRVLEPDARPLFGSAGRERASQFSWEQTAALTIEAYRAAIR
jgi:glycosyltransferase involved in cell wall biosynthesis